MKQITWSDITVEQFQEVYQLSLSADIDEISRVERVVTIMYGLTSEEVDSLHMPDFNQMAKQCTEIMAGVIPGKPVKEIKISGHRYSIIYDPSKLRHRQYVELMQYGDKLIENMHLIMASLVQPVTWYGKKLKNNVDDHALIADEMRNARFIDVYHCCVFFCKLYINLMEDLKDSLIKKMTTAGKPSQELIQLINNSQSIMAGSIIQERWPLLKA